MKEKKLFENLYNIRNSVEWEKEKDAFPYDGEHEKNRDKIDEIANNIGGRYVEKIVPDKIDNSRISEFSKNQKAQSKTLSKIDYVDAKAVAKYFNVKLETVENWIKERRLSGCHVEGKYMVPKEEFEYLKLRRDVDKTEEIMIELLGEEYTSEWKIEIEE